MRFGFTLDIFFFTPFDSIVALLTVSNRDDDKSVMNELISIYGSDKFIILISGQR